VVIAVQEIIIGKKTSVPSVIFIDVELAMSDIQREYVELLKKAKTTKAITRCECSFSLSSDDDEILRMAVDLPQLVADCVSLYIDENL
jgi:hypothetical protein